MGRIADAFAAAWPNGPASNPSRPMKEEIRPLGIVIESEVQAAAAGTVRTDSWAVLSAIPGSRAGQPGEVTADSGAHTDPVVGGTVSNKGSYSWSASPAGWKRVGDLIDPATVTALGVDVATLDSTKATKIAPIVFVASNGGTPNSQTAADVAGFTLANGNQLLWFPNATNTATDPTLKIGALAALPVKSETGSALASGEILASRPYLLRISNSGTEFRILTRGDTVSLNSRAPVLAPLPSVNSDGGSANAQTVSAVPSTMTAYAGGQQFLWFPNATNTATDPTLNIGSFGALVVKDSSGGALSPGDVIVGNFYVLRLSTAGGNHLRVISSALMPSTIKNLIGANAVAPLDPFRLNLADPWDFLFLDAAIYRDVASDGTPLVATDVTTGGNFLSVPRDAINGNTFSAGLTTFLSAVAGRFLIRQFNAAGAEIRNISDGNGDYRTELTIAAGASEGSKVVIQVNSKPIAPACRTIYFYLQASPAAGTVKVGLPWLSGAGHFTGFSPSLMTKGRVAYVGPMGAVGNSGTPSSPFKTLRNAHASGASKIVLLDGLYDLNNIVIDGSMFGGVEIMTAPDAQPVIRGGIPVTGFTAVSGRTDVYVASCLTAPSLYHVTSPKGFVFCLGAPYSAIATADRHPCHHGRSHRLPHYPLFGGPTSVATLEADARKSWWYDNTNKLLYVRSVPGVDPATMVIYVPFGDGTANRRRHNEIRILGLTYEFCGLEFADTFKYDLEGLVVVGAPMDGLSLDRVSGSDRFCSIVGSSNDNHNGHGTSGDTPGRQDGYSSIDLFQYSEEPYSAWAWDDCRSVHERARAKVAGGLLEFGGSTGSAPAQGAEETLDGTEVRSCGWDNVSDRGGISVVNAVSDDGTGTVVNCRNVTVRDCPKGFAAWIGSSHRLTLYDTRTVGCTEHAIYSGATGAVIDVHRHHDSGSAAVKGGPGTINVDNGTLVA